jgi:hypothetical protein
LAVIVLSAIGFVFNLIAFQNTKNDDFEFDTDTIYVQLLFFYMAYIYIFVFVLIDFIFCIQFILLLFKIKNENQSLQIEKKSSESLFRFISAQDQKNYILEAINDNPDLPKYLFYQKKSIPNQL